MHVLIDILYIDRVFPVFYLFYLKSHLYCSYVVILFVFCLMLLIISLLIYVQPHLYLVNSFIIVVEKYINYETKGWLFNGAVHQM